MSYLLMRDAVLVVTFALSWIFFQPNIVATDALPITGSVATLFLLLALAVKLSRRVDDDVAAYRLATAFLVIGATLYYFPWYSLWRLPVRITSRVCQPSHQQDQIPRWRLDHVGFARGRGSCRWVDLLPRHGFRWSHHDDARPGAEGHLDRPLSPSSWT